MVRSINSFFAFICIFFLTLLGFLVLVDFDFSWAKEKAIIDTQNAEKTASALEEQILQAYQNIDSLSEVLDADAEAFEEQRRLLQELAQKSSEQTDHSKNVYEEIIVARLGEPISRYDSEKVEILIFEMAKEDLRGYMAKVKLKDPSALKIVLAPEDKHYGETTSQAAEREGAIFAVNGGGFWTGISKGITRILPLGNTIIAGEQVGDFVASYNDLAFVGFTETAKLVGGLVKTQEELDGLGAYQGLSFVPVLIKEWLPVDIPSKWAKQRQPRTVLGQYPNNDLFFIVVDGRQSNWSSGITLEEMQVTLMRLGVMEAFNLDGGGSSSFVYEGKVMNKPSDGQERKVITNLLVMP